MDIGSKSIRGKVRERDEDAILVMGRQISSEHSNDEAYFCALADGMGGGDAGDIASRIALQTMESIGFKLLSRVTTDPGKIVEEINDGYRRADRKIVEYSMENSLREMGTTLVTAYYVNGMLYVGNIGDSRLLIFNDGKVSARTTDHSYVQTLVFSGSIKDSEVNTHPRRNEMTKALGFQGFAPDIYIWKIFNGDSVLLCCDGLWEPLDYATLGAAANSTMTSMEAVEQLVNLANEIDGTDNISAIMFRPRVKTSLEKYSRKPTKAAPK
ncbi:MAG: protein phosphatase 2C domain-containing protein [Candidatus Thermoplasmatota archaeon]|nr:protein phosphatase 2C domain-containing protein [Candidatus Thermoplasmatota archaeon]MCL5665886.1 protein phosphatase 2C domain-containing protein [Candidatus Thermoplasmatota archaeon]